VLARIVVPAAETHGYVVVRADQIKTPGMLIFQIWRFLLDAELVIADLTGANLNVHYELGIRHAITKPVLQLAERGEMLAFDVAGVRTVFIDTRTADGIRRSAIELDLAIGAAEAVPDESSPASSLFTVPVATRSASERDRKLLDSVAEFSRQHRINHISTTIPSSASCSSTEWKLEFTTFFDRTLSLLPPEADRIVSELLAVIARDAHNIPTLPGLTMRMIKSHSYQSVNRAHSLPAVRVYFAFNDAVDTVLLLVAEQEESIQAVGT